MIEYDTQTSSRYLLLLCIYTFIEVSTAVRRSYWWIVIGFRLEKRFWIGNVMNIAVKRMTQLIKVELLHSMIHCLNALNLVSNKRLFKNAIGSSRRPTTARTGIKRTLNTTDWRWLNFAIRQWSVCGRIGSAQWPQSSRQKPGKLNDEFNWIFPRIVNINLLLVTAVAGNRLHAAPGRHWAASHTRGQRMRLPMLGKHADDGDAE